VRSAVISIGEMAEFGVGNPGDVYNKQVGYAKQKGSRSWKGSTARRTKIVRSRPSKKEAHSVQGSAHKCVHMKRYVRGKSHKSWLAPTGVPAREDLPESRSRRWMREKRHEEETLTLEIEDPGVGPLEGETKNRDWRLKKGSGEKGWKIRPKRDRRMRRLHEDRRFRSQQSRAQEGLQGKNKKGRGQKCTARWGEKGVRPRPAQYQTVQGKRRKKKST